MDLTFSSFMDAVCAWSEISGFPYRQYKKGNSADTYVIRFDMGARWSLFFGKFIKGEHFHTYNLQVEVIERTVIIEFLA